MQDPDILTTAFVVALFWGLWMGARIPIALAAMVVGLLIAVLLTVILYSIGIVPDLDRGIPDLTHWLPRLISGMTTFIVLALFHIARQRREGRPGW